MAIFDPAAKQQVLNAIRSKVGDDTFYGVMTLVIGDVQQSRTLVAAYGDLAEYVVKRIVSRGLDRALPSFKPPTALTPDVERWILKRLASRGTSNVIDMMFSGPNTISAECALSQLAKEGFTDTVYGQ
jgi:hypothetical protein